MKILLTGATGLIGKELGKALVANGHEVISVSRSAAKAKKLLPYQTEVVEWLGEDVFPASIISKVDGVIHLMGENIADERWTAPVKKRLVDSRVNATRFLKQACESRSEKLKFWIQGSAIGYYGDSEQENIFTEESHAGEGFLADLCEQWEAAAGRNSVKSVAQRMVILRTGVVISHQGGALDKMMNPLLAGVGGVIGSGEQRMSVIHLTDEVRFIVHAVETESVKGVYNLVGEEPVTQKTFIKLLAHKLHITTGLPIPGFAIKLAMGEMGSLLLQDQAVISDRLKESGFELKYPRLEQMLDEVAPWYRHPDEHAKPAHLFYSEQFLPFPVERVFDFFSDAKNLEKITPKWLNFHIVSVSTPAIQKHTKIEYELKLHKIPMKWLTDISEWDPPHRFVDQQLKGPYHLWYHEHSFEQVEGGTLMKDWVRFQLPLGKAGLVGLPKVYGDVKGIFAYRADIIGSLFN